ncbi:MAG: hypothetical protein RIQ41_291 [Candidatus Parcubacteria bacterium]|jgi:hypothetical protein
MSIQSFLNTFKVRTVKGFVLPLTLVVCVIILTIATGISVILAKELYFSKLSRLSQVAYYAADSALMCATMIDDQYIDPDTGMGIFEYNNLVTADTALVRVNQQRAARGLEPVTLSSIKCATSEIFNPTTSSYSVAPFNRVDSAGNPEVGRATTFSMTMDLGTGETRCAQVIINKTVTYRQIIARGFASCASSSVYPIERAIVSTSEVAAITASTTTTPQVTVNAILTSGSSWTVPAGITSVKLWVVGAGGGGGGAYSFWGEYATQGGGGSGGVVYKEFTVNPGEVISYTLGGGGTSGSSGAFGSAGGSTIVTLPSGQIITALGGGGGNSGGGGSGGHGSTSGLGVIIYTGGAGNIYGGGGIGTANASGFSGAQANDVSGLFAVLTAAGYATTGPGAYGGCGSVNGGWYATGFGSGGGSSSCYGGTGGVGLYGGGGGGSGSTQDAWGGVEVGTGGNGGSGVVVISAQ